MLGEAKKKVSHQSEFSIGKVINTELLTVGRKERLGNVLIEYSRMRMVFFNLPYPGIGMKNQRRFLM